MTNVTKYDATDTTVQVDSVYITGLGENMVSGSKNEDLISTSVGAQGDVVKNIINDPIGEVTVTIQSTSPSKEHLMGLVKRVDNFPLWATNKTLGERMGGSQACLKSYPEIERGKESEDLEFVFTVMDYTVEAI
jgi:hypothetical protein